MLLRPTGIGENEVGLYQAVVMDSRSNGALGKSHVRCESFWAVWNCVAMSEACKNGIGSVDEWDVKRMSREEEGT